MWTLLLWWGVSAATVLGYVTGGHMGPMALGTTFAALVSIAFAALAFSLVKAARRRASWSFLLFAVVMLAGARGLSRAPPTEPELRWTIGARGLARGLFEVEVVGASTPGPRCEVVVRQATSSTLLLSMSAEMCPLAAGDRLRLPVGRVRPLFWPALPGEPNPVAIAASRGADLMVEVDRAFIASRGDPGYWSWIAELRQEAWARARNDDAVAFVMASCIGLRPALSPELRGRLRRSGLGHLVAVSGMHVGIAAWLTFGIFVRIGRLISGSVGSGVVLSWLPVLSYVVLTGGAPSATRAAVMLVLHGVGTIVGRPVHGMTILAVTSALMLLFRPEWAVDPGFQLSVAAMAALVSEPDAGWVRTSWRVTWAVVPIALVRFGDAPIHGVLANLVAVPVFSIFVLPLGLIGSLPMTWGSEPVLAPARWGAALVLDAAELFSQIPAPAAPWLAVLASVLVVLRVLVRRPPWAAWARASCPPVPAVVAVLVLVLGSVVARQAQVVESVLVLGTPRRAAVAFVRDEGGSAIACVVDPDLRAREWARMIASLHVVVAEISASGAVRRELDEADIPWRLGHCPAPPPAAPDWLRTCAALSGSRVGLARFSDGLQCFARGAWRSPASRRSW